MSAFSGSVMIRTKSASVSDLSSTRIGKRPCSSGMRSLGLATWKAPAAMNSTWSVFTIPYLVCTFDPSTIGRRSRCTPSRETSGPPACAARSPAILSISSRKMIPIFSTRSSASAVMSSRSTSFSISCSYSVRRASETLTVRFFLRLGIISWNISAKFSNPSGAPFDAIMSNIDADWCATSI